MHMDADHLELMNTLLQTAETQPAGKCARIYRGLAKLVSDPKQAGELNSIANAFCQLEARCHAFKVSFNQKQP